MDDCLQKPLSSPFNYRYNNKGPNRQKIFHNIKYSKQSKKKFYFRIEFNFFPFILMWLSVTVFSLIVCLFRSASFFCLFTLCRCVYLPNNRSVASSTTLTHSHTFPFIPTQMFEYLPQFLLLTYVQRLICIVLFSISFHFESSSFILHSAFCCLFLDGFD